MRLPSAEGFEIVEGVSELTHRRVAATAASAFVLSDRVLLRAPHDDGDPSAAEPVVVRRTKSGAFRKVGATSTRLFVLSDEGLETSADEGATFSLVATPSPVRELRTSASSAVITDFSGEIRRWNEGSASFDPIAAGELDPVLLAASDGTTMLADTGVAVFRSQAASAFSPVLGLEPWGYRDLVIAGEASVAITIFGDLRTSTDAGATFSVPMGDLAAFGPASRVAATTSGFVATTTAGIVRSSDGGGSFSLVVPSPSADGVPDVATSGDTVVVSTPTVRTSDDGGATFSPPLPIHDASIVSLVRAGSFLLASTADRRGHATSGALWQPVETSGNVARGAADDGRRLYLLLGSNLPWERGYGSSYLVSSVDGGAVFENVTLPAQAPADRFDAITTHDGFVYLGSSFDWQAGSSGDVELGSGVFRSGDGGLTWQSASAGLPTSLGEGGAQAYIGVRALASAHDTLVILMADGSLLRRRDGEEVWQPATEGLSMSHVDALHQTPAGLFASSSVAPREIFAWDEVAYSWAAAPAAGLPDDATVDTLASDGGALYVGVDSAQGPGLYVSEDGGATFRDVGLRARPLSLAALGDTLFAGTLGEGLFQAALEECEP
ncbi:MAG: hypothetical protein JNL21_15735 [Myxococcales bacterium]|nr:hypothetical protein [Myxococcales bacterium]